jgi:GNAT superfamily N-acetyltransferase
VARFVGPEPLDRKHTLEGFDCGIESLNTWLTRYARQADAVGSARTFVMVDAGQQRVVGYYALTVASITHAEATARARKGMPQHPIPAVLLARLAVDQSVTGRGIGAWLLRDAMLRTLAAAEELGVRVLLVHAIDERARAFYERFGFEASPTDLLNLQLLMKDVRAAVEASTVEPS